MILLTNDDGITAEGIRFAYEALRELDEILIVAPDSQKSAIGHGITIDKWIPLTYTSLWNGTKGIAVGGTPADCVKIALTHLCIESPPRLVVSGINLGPNTSTNILYSGTVAAALEASILGFSAIAISLATFVDPDYSSAVLVTQCIARSVLQLNHPGLVLNVNVPNVPFKHIKGARITKQGIGRYRDVYMEDTTPSASYRLKLAGDTYISDSDPHSDDVALNSQQISITPIGMNVTRQDWHVISAQLKHLGANCGLESDEPSYTQSIDCQM